MLTALVGSWRHIAEDSQRCRRENLFDAMSQQVQQAKTRCQAFEILSERSLQVLDSSQNFILMQQLVSSWRIITLLAHTASTAPLPLLGHSCLDIQPADDSQAPVPVSLARSGRLQRSMSDQRPFAAITQGDTSRHCPDRSQRSPTGSMSVPHGGGGVHQRIYTCQQELGRDSSTDRSRPQSPARAAFCATATDIGTSHKSSSSRAGRQPLTTREIATTEVGHEAKKPLPRGPERFFYDTTGYTGCARFGGPSVVDKPAAGDKENMTYGGSSRVRGSLALPCGSPKVVHRDCSPVAAPVHASGEAGPPAASAQASTGTSAPRRRVVLLR